MKKRPIKSQIKEINVKTNLTKEPDQHISTIHELNKKLKYIKNHK
ncbi:hypothetical protein M2373_001991 [Chryseobacterium sp. JUb7]|nr:hypothetical protein [Chryseobacterium sp. JUb7]